MRKNVFLKLSMILFIATVFTISLFSQDTIPENSIPGDPSSWFDLSRVEWLYGVIVIIGGYLSAFIPGLKNISVGVYRVLTWAVLTGAGALYFGADIWGVAITYFMATGLYEIVLKLIFRSPQPTDRNGRPVNGKIEPLIS